MPATNKRQKTTHATHLPKGVFTHILSYCEDPMILYKRQHARVWRTISVRAIDNSTYIRPTVNGELKRGLNWSGSLVYERMVEHTNYRICYECERCIMHTSDLCCPDCEPDESEDGCLIAWYVAAALWLMRVICVLSLAIIWRMLRTNNISRTPTAKCDLLRSDAPNDLLCCVVCVRYT